VIDLYKQGLYASVRYEPNVTTLKSGFSGIAYDGADKPFPLIKEPMAPKGSLHLIDKGPSSCTATTRGRRSSTTTGRCSAASRGRCRRKPTFWTVCSSGSRR
jgi:hypothetical protein